MKIFTLPLAIALLSLTLPTVEKKVILYPNGNKHFEYELKSKLLNGQFTSYYENGRIKLQGQLKNNQKTGVWTAWDENGTKRSERKFTDNYSFEIINEWDAGGKPIESQLLQNKNERIIGARSKEVQQKQMSYIQRFWREIASEEEGNKYLFENNAFYNFLVTQACNKRLNAFQDDRHINAIEDIELLKSYKGATPVNFIIKEDLIFTRDHEVMHTKVIGVCPVVMINGERKEVGWFFIPYVRNHREAGDDIETIVSRLEKHHYAATITRTTIDRGGEESREVRPAESDYYLLSPIEYEAHAWIYFSEK
jgi:hypothetical protein